MIKVNKNQAVAIQTSPSTVICEYQMDEKLISGALAHINGRYPISGFAINEISKKLVYIIAGTGKIIISDKETNFAIGDVLFTDRVEYFAWKGKFSMFMVSAPKFDPTQHKITLTPLT